MRNKMTPAGLEPAIPGSVGRCLIHWATGPVVSKQDSCLQCEFNDDNDGTGCGKRKMPCCAQDGLVAARLGVAWEVPAKSVNIKFRQFGNEVRM